MSIGRNKIILSIILLLSFSLNILGITWGLPDRWNVDEPVSVALKMGYNKSIIPENDPYHPTFYYFFLIIFFGIYVLFLKIIGYPLEIAASIASISWINFANTDSFLASSFYLIARGLSGLIGTATVFVVFLIAKKLYNEKIALFSAIILTMTVGFIADNHYAKSSALVNFLSVLTIFYCIKAIYENKFKFHFLTAAFLGGLSIATKYNGGILIIPLFITYLQNYLTSYPYRYISRNNIIKYIKDFLISKMTAYASGCYIFGFFVGFPGIFIYPEKYLSGYFYYREQYVNSSQSFWVRIYDFSNGILLYFYEITIVYGIFLALIVFAGIIIAIKNKNQGKWVVFSLIIPYFLIVASFQITKEPQTKYIILIVPFLSIFGGLFINKILEYKIIPISLKYLFLSTAIFFSIRQVAFTEMIFVKNDIRYLMTDWIGKNIPKGSSIEIFTEIDWYFSSKLLEKYNVVFFGINSKDSKNVSQFKIWLNEDSKQNYYKKLQINGPKSEYIIISHFDFSEEFLKHIKDKERTVLLNNLIKGKWNYKVIKKFSYDDKPFWAYLINYTPKYLLVLKHAS